MAKKGKASKLTSVLREAFAIILWLYLISKLIFFDWDIYCIETYLPNCHWLIQYKFFIIIGCVTVLLLIIGTKKFYKFLFFCIGYPLFVIFWRVPHLCFKNWTISLVFMIAAFDIAKSFKTFFSISVFALISCLFIIISKNRYVLMVSMIFLAATLVFHLIQKFRKAYGASLFQGLTDKISVVKNKIEKGGLFNLSKDDFESDVNKDNKHERSGKLSSVYMSNFVFNYLADRIDEIHKNRKIDLYLILSLVVTIIATIIIYSLEYYGLYKIFPSSFIGDNLNISDFIGYSFSILTTSDLSSIEPSHWISGIISYSQVGCAGLILIILVFTILTAARERYISEIKCLVSELKNTAVVIEQKMIDNCQKSILELEQILAQENPKLIDNLRKMRGLPELKKEDNPEDKKTDINDDG